MNAYRVYLNDDTTLVRQAESERNAIRLVHYHLDEIREDGATYAIKAVLLVEQAQ